MIHKFWLLLMPLIVLLMGCSMAAKPVAKKAPTVNRGFNSVTIDVSRHHYQVSTLVKFIRLVSDHHGNFIQLHLSDDKDFAIENKAAGQTTRGATKTAGVWQNKKSHQAFYSRGQIAYLLKDAKQHHITLIPEIDTPAHVTGLVKTLRASGQAKLAKQLSWQSKSYGDELHLNAASIAFVKRMDREIASEFANQRIKRFHLGGDEFTDKLTKNTAYINYLNATSENVEKLGFTPEAWNDGFLTNSLKAINHDIQVTYWNWTADQSGELGKERKKAWASMPRLIHNGFKVFNYNDYYLYFNVSKANLKPKSVAYMSKDMKQYWTPMLWHTDHQTKLKTRHGIVGSSASIWSDAAGRISDQQIYQASTTFIEDFLKLARKA